MAVHIRVYLKIYILKVKNVLVMSVYYVTRYTICNIVITLSLLKFSLHFRVVLENKMYEGWNFNSGNYLFTTDTK